MLYGILRSLAILVQMGGQNSAFKQEPQRVLIQMVQGPFLERKQKKSIYWPYPRNKKNGDSEKILAQANSFIPSFSHLQIPTMSIDDQTLLIGAKLKPGLFPQSILLQILQPGVEIPNNTQDWLE